MDYSYISAQITQDEKSKLYSETGIYLPGPDVDRFEGFIDSTQIPFIADYASGYSSRPASDEERTVLLNTGVPEDIQSFNNSANPQSESQSFDPQGYLATAQSDFSNIWEIQTNSPVTDSQMQMLHNQYGLDLPLRPDGFFTGFLPVEMVRALKDADIPVNGALATSEQVQNLRSIGVNILSLQDYVKYVASGMIVKSTGNSSGPVNSTPLFGDSEFVDGPNSLLVYNNDSGSAVTLNAVNDPNSGRIVRFFYDGSPIPNTPGHGGFIDIFNATPGDVYLLQFLAKIPSGYYVNATSNGIGTNGTLSWDTTQNGTGNYQFYTLRIQCGDAGTFGTAGHVFFTGPQGPLTVDIASSNIYKLVSTASPVPIAGAAFPQASLPDTTIVLPQVYNPGIPMPPPPLPSSIPIPFYGAGVGPFTPSVPSPTQTTYYQVSTNSSVTPDQAVNLSQQYGIELPLDSDGHFDGFANITQIIAFKGIGIDFSAQTVTDTLTHSALDEMLLPITNATFSALVTSNPTPQILQNIVTQTNSRGTPILESAQFIAKTISIQGGPAIPISSVQFPPDYPAMITGINGGMYEVNQDKDITSVPGLLAFFLNSGAQIPATLSTGTMGGNGGFNQNVFIPSQVGGAQTPVQSVNSGGNGATIPVGTGTGTLPTTPSTSGNSYLMLGLAAACGLLLLRKKKR